MANFTPSTISASAISRSGAVSEDSVFWTVWISAISISRQSATARSRLSSPRPAPEEPAAHHVQLERREHVPRVLGIPWSMLERRAQPSRCHACPVRHSNGNRCRMCPQLRAQPWEQVPHVPGTPCSVLSRCRMCSRVELHHFHSLRKGHVANGSSFNSIARRDIFAVQLPVEF